MPLSLSGVRRIMEAMDWGDVVDFVSFGEVGRDQIDDHDYYILISPQNVVGNTIMTNLSEMVSKCIRLHVLEFRLVYCYSTNGFGIFLELF